MVMVMMVVMMMIMVVVMMIFAQPAQTQLRSEGAAVGESVELEHVVSLPEHHVLLLLVGVHPWISVLVGRQPPSKVLLQSVHATLLPSTHPAAYLQHQRLEKKLNIAVQVSTHPPGHVRHLGALPPLLAPDAEQGPRLRQGGERAANLGPGQSDYVKNNISRYIMMVFAREAVKKSI